jgi:hypothetical protein
MATTNTTNGIQIKIANGYFQRTFYFGTTGQASNAGGNSSMVVKLSKQGGAFANSTNAAQEIANGFYYVTLTGAETGTQGDLSYYVTATTGGPASWNDQVVPQLFTDLSITGSGLVNTSSNAKQGQPIGNFPFTMTSTATGAPLPGLTVIATRYIGGWSPCVNTPIDVGFGDYTINLAGSDTNAPVVMYRFTASNANDVNILLITQP